MYVLLLVDSVSPGRDHDVDGMIAIAGSVYTEITSAGGPAITLAASEKGVVTSFAGSVYTVATASAGSAVTGSGYASTAVHYRDESLRSLCFRNAAVANVRPFHISVPVLTALVTTAGGVLFGAWVAV